MSKRVAGLCVILLMLLSGCGFEDVIGSVEGISDLFGAGDAEEAPETVYEEPEEYETFYDVEETVPEPAEPEPDIVTVTVSATGDCAIGKVQVHGYPRSFDNYYDDNGPDYFLENVRPIFEADDFTLVNCECTLTNETAQEDKEYCIKGKPEYVQIFSGSSVEGATLGNNHNADYGEQSLYDTENTLTEAGIQYGLNDHYGIYETESGITIGFVSVSMLADRSAYLKEGLETLRDQVDILIACPHMGVERENYANGRQQEIFHNCVDWGADLVIGNHPHVLQGAEVYNGKVLMYSLGNFCFGANHNPNDYDTVIFQQTFTFVDGVMTDQIDAGIIPCSISSDPPEAHNNNYQPTPYSQPEDIARVIEKMNDFSSGFSGTVYFDEQGNLRKRF